MRVDMKNKFIFDTKTILDTFKFDESLSEFKGKIENESDGHVLDLTIREIIQNSLDARISLKSPLKVKIYLSKVEKRKFPGLNEVFDRINSLEAKSDYNRRIVNLMREQENIDLVKTLIVEDENTSGLNGAMSGDLNSQYYSYAYSTGNHFEK